MGLGLGDRLMFYAPRHDEELAFVELDDPVTQLDVLCSLFSMFAFHLRGILLQSREL